MTEKRITNLVMVTADNHNKFYKMIPNGENFIVEFGRVGCAAQSTTYNMRQWDKKYKEKVAKGYVDQTDLQADLVTIEKPKKSEYKDIENKCIAEIVERLQQMARQTIKDNYTISSNKVTQAMINEAQSILIALMSCNTVNNFNKELLRLFTTIPRKMGHVSDYLADKIDDFGRIIEKEQDLLDVMEGQVIQHIALEEDEDQEIINQKPITVLEAMGITFEHCSDTEIDLIKKNLGDCSNKFHQAWKVKNLKTQEKFDQFVNGNNIQTKYLWHGSRNENWWSIINTGLLLKPTNAVITGKMFGIGCYFAPAARKSLGYTSLDGSYWVRGNSSSAFMGLMNVAYGKPYDVYSFDNKYYSFNYDKLQQACSGANCLHAHAGSMLKNDEIIVYREDQMTINYLVELRN